MRDRLRRFLHYYGRHWLCEPRMVVDEVDYSEEYIHTRDGKLLDVTAHPPVIKRYHWEHR